MAIYGRCGQEVKILRKAVLADVKALDNRLPDKHDRDRIALGCYIVVEDGGKKRLYDYVYLRADGACQEIDAALKKVEAEKPMTKQEVTKWYDAVGDAKDACKAEGDLEGVEFFMEWLKCPQTLIGAA